MDIQQIKQFAPTTTLKNKEAASEMAIKVGLHHKLIFHKLNR